MVDFRAKSIIERQNQEESMIQIKSGNLGLNWAVGLGNAQANMLGLGQG